jgi:glutathione S-transferase
MKLIMGNKNYSSWSMRPWIAMKVAAIDFEEEIIPLRRPDTKSRVLLHSPAGKLPILVDSTVVIWETMAILEYLHEKFPNAQLWPADPAARAHARSVSNEMHAAFGTLRRGLSMNIKRIPRAVPVTPELQADIDRIVSIWVDCRSRFASQGRFLFGDFCNADAMFAPVVNRFSAYDVAVPDSVRSYMSDVMALPAWQQWTAEAVSDKWSIDEIDSIGAE